MHKVAHFLTQHRLKRFHRWAMLCLKGLAAMLNEAGPLAPLAKEVERIGHSMLDEVEHLVLCLVMLRAAPHVRTLNARKGVAEHQRKERGFARAMMGARMRRLLRAKDLRERIDALSQDLDVLVAHMLRRLPRGLTRRRSIHARREPDLLALLCAVLMASAVADTS